jgi:hypothetical protein
MNKLLALLGLTVAVSLSGCTLYFGEEHNGDRCPPGTYESSDDWGNDTCTPGGGNGYDCVNDNQCATGCYCDENTGTCNEAGYCSSDSDCGSGMSCDCSNSCVPAGTETRSCGSTCFELGCPLGYTCAADGGCIPDAPTCTDNSQCAAGCYCTGGVCEETTICGSDSDCPADQHCDVARSTCMPGAPVPTTSCGGTITCTLGAPTCPAGQVPLIEAGCWTGTCAPIETCTATPSCGVLNTEGLCLARAECAPVYSGQNCTNPSTGLSCTMGQSGCTCETFSFDHCR